MNSKLFVMLIMLKLMLIFNMTQLKPLSYNTYQYPQWAIGIGWIIGIISVLPIPLYMAIVIYNSEGTLVEVIINKFFCVITILLTNEWTRNMLREILKYNIQATIDVWRIFLSSLREIIQALIGWKYLNIFMEK